MNPQGRFAQSLMLMLLVLFCAANAHAAVNINYVVNNHLGAPVLLVDQNQHVVWQAEYDEFGKATILVEEVEFNVRFPGQYYDKETGLTYNYYREYDAERGRYVQSDPRGILLDFSDPQRQVAAMMGVTIPQKNQLGYLNHSYGYVDQNPLVSIDPLGEGIVGDMGEVVMGAGFVLGQCKVPYAFPVAVSMIAVGGFMTIGDLIYELQNPVNPDTVNDLIETQQAIDDISDLINTANGTEKTK